MQIGIAGLGRMGAAIAGRLIEAGHTLSVWNRSPEKAGPLEAAGAALARSPGELAAKVGTVITILTDAAAIETVYDGPSGLLSGKVAGKLFIEMSTVRPQTEIDLAGRVRAKGAGFVECPVGGTVGPARQGKLIGLMGAEEDDAARARPILAQLCRRLEHVGPVGNGALMKLAINLPLLVYWQALGEALALSRSVGLDPSRLMDLFADTSGGTNVIKMRGPAVATMLEGGDPGPVGFPIDGGLKDLRTMLAEGKARGLELPLVERTLACFEQASRDRWGGRDAASMPVYWTEKAAR
ncbi:MAG: NAD(P)-dependent oxidoreductase [Alphaproteobacteria bacterium]|nr:MAG: NAD(P)-dependent oxidoreductase [Alphaproteobacteria bacterium]